MGMNINVDVEFRRDMLDVYQGARLKYCYQCSHCVDKCPVSDIVGKDKYNPRKLVLYSLLGFKENVLGKANDERLWACTSCDTCDEVCPNDIELTDLFYILRNKSFRAGEAPEAYTMQAKTIYESGEAIPVQEAVERTREKLGLPKLPKPSLDEIQTIMKETGIAEYLK